MRTIVNTEKRCPVCTNVYRVLDDAGEPLPAEQREWDRVKASRYRGGERWRAGAGELTMTGGSSSSSANALRRMEIKMFMMM